MREFRANDAEALVACSQDKAVARFMRWAPQTLDEAHILVERADVSAFVFEQLRAHRLYALIHEENRVPLRFAEKMGLTFEGKQREYFLEDSVWKDVLLYSTLRGEWEAMRANVLPTLDGRT